MFPAGEQRGSLSVCYGRLCGCVKPRKYFNYMVEQKHGGRSMIFHESMYHNNCNNSLTPLRSRIFLILQKMKKNNLNIIKGCTTMDGKVYVFMKPVRHGEKDQRHWIVNMDTLRTFCRDYLEKSLDTFLDESNTFPNRG